MPPIEHPQGAPGGGATVELAFPVQGDVVPSDHAYLLYSAVCQAIPRWKSVPGAMAAIPGKPDGTGLRTLGPRPWLRFRLAGHDLAELLPLTGRTLDVGGRAVGLGVPRARLLTPAVALVSRLTTIKGFVEPEPFAAACLRQLESLGIRGRVVVGNRNVVRVHGQKIVGFRTLVADLAADESLRLQEVGIGGRRKLGCGFFSPYRG